MVVATVMTAMTTMTTTTMLQSERCCRWRGQQAQTVVASRNDNPAAATMAQHVNKKMTGNR
jgi:hypothetical protein